MRIFCESYSEKTKEAQNHFNAVSKIRDACRDAYVHAENLLKFFEQLEKAEKDLADCSSAEKGIQDAAGLIGQIEAAYEIQAVFQRYDDIRKTAADTKQKIADWEEKLPVLQRLFEEASKREAEAKIQQEAELEIFTKVSERVKAALETLKKIEEAKTDLKAKEESCKQCDKAAAAAVKELADLEAQEHKWRQQSEQLAKADTLLALWEVRSREADQIAAEAEAAKETEQDVEKQRKKAQKARKEYEKARDAFEEKNKMYIAARTSYLDAQAGFLAKEKLKPGRPCPVCGSTEHPNPCELSEEHQDLTRESIEKLSEEAGALQTEQETKSKAAGEGLGLLNEKEENFKKMMDRLSERMSKQIPDVPDDLNLKLAAELSRRWQETIRSEGETLKKDVKTLADVKKSLSGVDERKRKLKEDADQAAEYAKRAKEAFTVSRTTLDHLEQTKDYPTAEEANAALALAKGAKEEKENVYRKANQTAKNAKQEIDRAESLLEQYKKDIVEQTEKQELREETYQAILLEKDLSEPEWKEITEKHRRTETADIQALVDAHHQKKRRQKVFALLQRKPSGSRNVRI